MSVVFVSEPVVRVYVDYIMWSVMYVTHEDADGYMEGGIMRNIKPYKHEMEKAVDFAKYINECIANAEQFVVEQYADGSKMMQLVR